MSGTCRCPQQVFYRPTVCQILVAVPNRCSMQHVTDIRYLWVSPINALCSMLGTCRRFQSMLYPSCRVLVAVCNQSSIQRIRYLPVSLTSALSDTCSCLYPALYCLKFITVVITEILGFMNQLLQLFRNAYLLFILPLWTHYYRFYLQ